MKNKTLVIDFPWSVTNGFHNHKHFRFGKKLPYETMTDEQILNFPIDDFADKECDLFLWVIQKKTPLGFKLLEKWGFKFHCILTWKKNIGPGVSGFYRNSENILYGYRGKMGIDIGEGQYIKTCFESSITKHSEKPNIFYESIRYRTKEPRIDIFSRKKHEGFDSWGDEVEPFLQTTLKGIN